MTKKNDKPNKPNFEPKITVRVIGKEELDPAIIDFLPPEIRDAILGNKKVTNGSNGETPPPEEPDKKEKKKPEEKINYNFKMINVKHEDLKTLTQKLKASKVKKWNMLLYGVSGAGKSYYGKYLAQQLGLNFIKVKCSSIIDKFVGQTERNLCELFERAREENAMLCFDEADSFLFNRVNMDRDFSIQAVNEMLVQLEEHTLPVILTTNLRDKLDSAMNRRVLFKVEYDYMTPSNVAEGIKTYFGKEFKLKPEQLKQLSYLTAGDFKVVQDKAAVLDEGKYTNESIFNYLKHEQDEKNIKEGSGEIAI